MNYISSSIRRFGSQYLYMVGIVCYRESSSEQTKREWQAGKEYDRY